MKTLTVNMDSLMREGNLRVHGNGFIQVDIPGTAGLSRLNIWPHPKIPTQETSTQIHNHVFGFESTILCGRLTNINYNVFHVDEDEATHGVYEALRSANEDTELWLINPNQRPWVKVEPRGLQLLSPGERYTQAPFDYHETVSEGLTATLMTKTLFGFKDFNSRVLCPVDCVPDNDYSRYQIDPKVSWDMVDEVLNRIAFHDDDFIRSLIKVDWPSTS